MALDSIFGALLAADDTARLAAACWRAGAHYPGTYLLQLQLLLLQQP
jgi:hypothetical protein